MNCCVEIQKCSRGFLQIDARREGMNKPRQCDRKNITHTEAFVNVEKTE
jgi:hypothetical protein